MVYPSLSSQNILNFTKIGKEQVITVSYTIAGRWPN